MNFIRNSHNKFLRFIVSNVITMIGYRFTEYIAPLKDQPPFDRLLEIFRQLLIITSGGCSGNFAVDE